MENNFLNHIYVTTFHINTLVDLHLSTLQSIRPLLNEIPSRHFFQNFLSFFASFLEEEAQKDSKTTYQVYLSLYPGIVICLPISLVEWCMSFLFVLMDGVILFLLLLTL